MQGNRRVGKKGSEAHIKMFVAPMQEDLSVKGVEDEKGGFELRAWM